MDCSALLKEREGGRERRERGSKERERGREGKKERKREQGKREREGGKEGEKEGASLRENERKKLPITTPPPKLSHAHWTSSSISLTLWHSRHVTVLTRDPPNTSSTYVGSWCALLPNAGNSKT